MIGDVAQTFEIEGSVTIAKVALTNNLVPIDKNTRKIYGALLSNKSLTPAGVTFTMEVDTTVQRTIPEITLAGHETLSIARSVDAPMLTIDPGQNVKAQVTTGTGPVSVILQAYDLD